MMNIRKRNGPTAAALEPLAQKTGNQAPIIRNVSRVAFKIGGDRAFEETIRCVVSWMKNRSPGIPKTAFEGEPFDVGGGGEHPAEAVRLDDHGSRLWAAILDYPCKDVAQRTWVTELTVGERDGRTAFGARLFNVTKGNDAHFVPSRPGVVHGILDKLAVEDDGVLLLPRVKSVQNEADFEQFRTLLLNPNRTLPLIVTTASPETSPPINLHEMCRKISGLAHLVTLTEDAAWQLTDIVGKKLSVYVDAKSSVNGAVRIYGPDFDPNESNPFDHSLWLGRPTDGPEEQERRLDQIIRWTLTNSVRSSHIPDFPRYSEIRRCSDERRSKAVKSQGQSDAVLVKLYEDEIDKLRKDLESEKASNNELLAHASADIKTAEAQERAVREENRSLRLCVEALRNALRANDRDIPCEPLEKYDDIETWAEQNLIGSVWIAPKALRETRKANFRDIERFSKTLLLLRDLYVPMRINPSPTAREAYNDALSELGLEDSACFSNRNDIKNFPEYKVTYGRDCFLCHDHIKYGGGYDGRDMFRIYYHWHEEEQKLLIGHMPTHLDNMRTS
ncbi:hypothetical protein IHV25_06135 [Phaeovibrio sulfidiphilus]|uniref:Uncharacterized protein n=1 Tax=Phaeovibrio sulfidiphilus TaxID=1220600 RepID=A0A8J6YZ50_9PROT|nr:hypothetical protein [Phaeovibrio sulfidiphilus]MBE1237223.1 hypothetical protein [Phaeovibrio sulfidiphilus]